MLSQVSNRPLPILRINLERQAGKSACNSILCLFSAVGIEKKFYGLYHDKLLHTTQKLSYGGEDLPEKD